MRIKYIGVRPRDVVAPGRTIHVRPGDVVEVGEKLGRSLLRQERKFEPAELTPKPKYKPAVADESKETSE